MRPLMKVQDAARALNCSRSHLYQLITSGELRAIRLGQRCVRIDPADVDAFLAARRSRPASTEAAPEEPRG